MVAAGVLAWRDELGVLKERLGLLFVRPEPRRQAGLYTALKSDRWATGGSASWRPQGRHPRLAVPDETEAWMPGLRPA